MPALSSSPPGPAAILSSPVYIILVILLLLGLGTIISRLRRQWISPSHQGPSDPLIEKAPLLPTHGPSSTNPPLRLPGGRSPYLSQTVAPMSSLPSSSSSQPSSAPEPIVDLDVPRRRSYTKITPAGTEVSGEIVVAEGWRRHTKVFGGGVCAACEENERRLKTIVGSAANAPSSGAGLA